MPKADIDRIVASKDKWIRSHLARASTLSAARSTFALDYDGAVTLFGRDYPIIAGCGPSVKFDGTSVTVPPDLDGGEIKRAVILLYRAIARDVLSERAGHFASLMGVIPAGIKITGAKTRWGSCSGKNSINFSWRLVMADDDVIDYVVAHELAHIREHNHSTRFWAVVESTLPDYADSRRKLKLLQEKLAAEDWDD